MPKSYRAVIFDIYGTLLVAAPGGVKPDPLADPVLRDILRQLGHAPPGSPSADLHAAVLRHHAAAGVPFPEVDLHHPPESCLDVVLDRGGGVDGGDGKCSTGNCENRSRIEII